MIRNILLPWDGSAPSQRAAAFLAAQLGAQTPAEVHVLHVLPDPPMLDLGADGRPSAVQSMERPAEDEARAAMTPAVDALRAAGIGCTVALDHGDAAQAIARYARSHHCESIVMGTHGRGAIAAAMLGSVAQKVLHLVDVPVTFVK